MDQIIKTPSVPRPVAPNTIGFLKLPIEIRFKIWELVANQPRNLDIWYRRLGHFEEERRRFACQVNRWVTLSAIPSILHVSRESRTIGLKFYQLDFGINIPTYYGMNIISEPRIYVNWDTDRIVAAQTNQHGYGAFSNMINSDERLCGTKLHKVAVRSDHYDPGLSKSLGRRFNEILIYYEPFVFYDRLKSRNLTIEFEPITGVDLICNKEKEALDAHVADIEKDERRWDEEVTRALAEGKPVPERLKNHIVGSWKKPAVKVGNIVIYGRTSDGGSENEIWTWKGWTPLSSVDTATK
ncbi:uncharacterized protein EAF02_005140 [Botrytis sinoallii]|uniref:uncharacterized protein n=1 Tax=Botrytis sinoallii TaxID=1463999 RepID=UPI0019025C1B|nr:uncharacterized protein EAF02_005140 [Botrytis sinoallii]KAF7883220.1 hypothetical protein EAF02_005140 [Botrytis sinoallii]